jgi:hypothetical protein
MQLGHERGLADRAYVRRGIENTIAAYEKALRAIMDLKGGLAVTDPTNELHLTEAEASRHDAQEALQAFWSPGGRTIFGCPLTPRSPPLRRLRVTPSSKLLRSCRVPALSEDVVATWDAAIGKAAKAHRLAMNTVRDELGAAPSSQSPLLVAEANLTCSAQRRLNTSN